MSRMPFSFEETSQSFTLLTPLRPSPFLATPGLRLINHAASLRPASCFEDWTAERFSSDVREKWSSISPSLTSRTDLNRKDSYELPPRAGPPCCGHAAASF